MPRISADTVPEHRARMFEALVDSTETLLHGRFAVTAGAVAARAGIARNSIYRYVDSIDDLIEAAIGRSFPRWAEAVRAAMLARETAEDRVVGYVRTNLELATDGSHAWHHALSRDTLSPSARQRMVSMHEALTELLSDALDGLPGVASDGRGGPDAMERSLLLHALQALVDTCIRQIDSGVESASVIEFAERKTRALLA